MNEWNFSAQISYENTFFLPRFILVEVSQMLSAQIPTIPQKSFLITYPDRKISMYGNDYHQGSKRVTFSNISLPVHSVFKSLCCFL